MAPHEQEELLREQVTHYRAHASDYLADLLAAPKLAELEEALVAFGASGDVLELACGPGTWTPVLLRTASTVTAVDAAPEMLKIAQTRVKDSRVRFLREDLFDFRPTCTYDAVFFGFWLSHVPMERFEGFWQMVRECLRPGGRVFFVDDANRTPDELIEGETSSTILRRTRSGEQHRIVKVPHCADSLEDRLRDLGWNVMVSSAGGGLYWGSGGLKESS
jgi:SAM-dependent methyltransferase